MKKPRIDDLSLSMIRIDGGTQQRAEINSAAVEEYAELYATGVQMPPLRVYFDGKHWWLARGFHRYHGANKAGKKKLPCEVINGTQRDAVLDSCGDNADHGLRRTRADIRTAVATMLRDPEWVKWTDNRIADACRTTQPTVASVRQELESASKILKVIEREGADGKTYRVEKIGRKPNAGEEVTSASIPSEANAALLEAASEDRGEPDLPPSRPAAATLTVQPAATPTPTAPTATSEVLDELGRTILPRHREVFEKRADFARLIAMQRHVWSGLKELQEHPAGIRIGETTKRQIDLFIGNIKDFMPYTTCPYCKGNGRDKKAANGECRACLAQGWVPKQIYDAAPREWK